MIVADHIPPALHRVNLSTGERQIVSSTPVDGIHFATDTAILPSGRIAVCDYGHQAIWGVDPTSGDRAIMSGKGRGKGPDLVHPFGVIVADKDSLVVLDRGTQSLIRVNCATGDRTVISSHSADAEVPFRNPFALTKRDNGDFLVFDNAQHALLNVTSSGCRSVLSSDAVGSGPSLRLVMAIHQLSDGKVLAVCRNSTLALINLENGDREPLSLSGATISSPVSTCKGTSPDTVFVAQFGHCDCAIVSIDLKEKKASLVTSANVASDPTVGSGAEMKIPLGCTLGDDGNLYYADAHYSSVVKVSLKNGRRCEVTSSTVGKTVSADRLHLHAKVCVI